jgi:hypothetical protein
MSRSRIGAAVLAVDAALMAGFYAVTMARLRSLPASIPWDGGTVVGLLGPFGAALVFANLGVVATVSGLRRDDESRHATVVTILAAIAAFAIAGLLVVGVLLGLLSQY